MFTILSNLTMYFLITVVFSGCISISEKDKVIEKSEISRPEWIENNGGISKDDTSKIDIVFMKSDVQNLGLGLKQAQSAASQLALYLIAQAISQQKWDNLGVVAREDSSRLSSLAMLLAHAIQNNHSYENCQKRVYPQAVYWERIQRDSVFDAKNFYTVWVLLHVSQSDYNNAKKIVSANWDQTSALMGRKSNR